LAQSDQAIYFLLVLGQSIQATYFSLFWLLLVLAQSVQATYLFLFLPQSVQATCFCLFWFNLSNRLVFACLGSIFLSDLFFLVWSHFVQATYFYLFCFNLTNRLILLLVLVQSLKQVKK
jgi:hypothetical protein